MPAFTLAHLSDLHVTPVRGRRPAAFLNKRMLGALSWAVRRRWEYRPDVLAALLDDLHAHAPDHVVITGDLTNLGLADEYADALTWLERLGGPRRVSLIPGNHDIYTSESAAYPWTYWAEYLRSRPEAVNGRRGAAASPDPQPGKFSDPARLRAGRHRGRLDRPGDRPFFWPRAQSDEANSGGSKPCSVGWPRRRTVASCSCTIRPRCGALRPVAV